ncbi:hypothetical protein M0M57_02465 [Flavobacterium azooxidireducens]|uniref:DUF1735 domain-containing protein n=1 Tax=Flavobacterium azooxidireducens TaxID=1871076 RepID=A0ABY4KHF9_9FLAO|nr:hypothetical protein [Flavobacterium azooxidireducens]UPQ79706.1 hypothetical protein M0M57_02465 [Flavobacterium azooxidireducens]
MKFNNIKLFSLFAILFFGALVSCEDESSTEDLIGSQNYVSFEENSTVYLVAGETMVKQAKVYASQASSVDRVVQLRVVTEIVSAPTVVGVPVNPTTTTANAANYSVATSVTIPAGAKEASFPVEIMGVGIGTGKVIVIEMVPQDGINLSTIVSGTQTNQNLTAISKRLLINIKEICGQNLLRIQINTDQYGSETTWELYSNSNLDTPIASGGPYPDQANPGVYPRPNVDVCLPDGDYTFVIYDSPYSDGMDSGYGAGFYRLVTMQPNLSAEINEIARNGVFGAFDIVEFSLP